MLKIESISEIQKYRRHLFTASRFINALMLLVLNDIVRYQVQKDAGQILNLFANASVVLHISCRMIL